MGRIKGISYVFRSSDTVTGQTSDYITSLSTTPYIKIWPTASTVRDIIVTDAKAHGAKAYLDTTRNQQPVIKPVFVDSDDAVVGISTQPVVLP